MNIQEMSIEQLKSLGFDCQNAIMVNQKNLEIINQEIQRRSQMSEVKQVEETKPNKKNKQQSLDL